MIFKKEKERDQKQISILTTSHFSPFDYCLGLYLEKGTYPENSHVVFYHSHSFHPFMCQKKWFYNL